jgi:hypothetical protein
MGSQAPDEQPQSNGSATAQRQRRERCRNQKRFRSAPRDFVLVVFRHVSPRVVSSSTVEAAENCRVLIASKVTSESLASPEFLSRYRLGIREEITKRHAAAPGDGRLLPSGS